MQSPQEQTRNFINGYKSDFNQPLVLSLNKDSFADHLPTLSYLFPSVLMCIDPLALDLDESVLKDVHLRIKAHCEAVRRSNGAAPVMLVVEAVEVSPNSFVNKLIVSSAYGDYKLDPIEMVMYVHHTDHGLKVNMTTVEVFHGLGHEPLGGLIKFGPSQFYVANTGSGNKAISPKVVYQNTKRYFKDSETHLAGFDYTEWETKGDKKLGSLFTWVGVANWMINENPLFDAFSLYTVLRPQLYQGVTGKNLKTVTWNYQTFARMMGVYSFSTPIDFSPLLTKESN